MPSPPAARATSLHLPTRIPEECERSLQAIRALVGTLSHSARTVEQRTGLSNAQLFILKQIAAEGPLSVNEVAARALTRQSTVSVLTGRLERAGLVERTRGQADARRTIISLTAEGRKLLRRAPQPPLARVLAAVCEMPKRERQALDLGLEALLRHLGVATATSRPMFEPAAPRRTRGTGATRHRRV